jgi:hypothetical protein
MRERGVDWAAANLELPLRINRSEASQGSHIFEVVCDRNRGQGSQKMPQGLPPLFAPTIGDFLALLANRGPMRLQKNLIWLRLMFEGFGPFA